jgi:hypothetical protein
MQTGLIFAGGFLEFVEGQQHLLFIEWVSLQCLFELSLREAQVTS